jgi:hypothetical protein
MVEMVEMVDVVDTKTVGLEWSQAYVLASSRPDKQSMLYLLGLVSWPPLSSMYGDLVDDLAQICHLLSKKPMVGYLVARRLRLREDETHALLSVLAGKGYIKAVGTHLYGNIDVFNVFSSASLHPVKAASMCLPASREIDTRIANKKDFHRGARRARTEVKTCEALDKLMQLWRVLNAEITVTLQTDKVDKADKAGRKG